VVGELRQLLNFIEAQGGPLVSKAPSLKGKQKRGVLFGCFGGTSLSFAEVVRGVVATLQGCWFRR